MSITKSLDKNGKPIKKTVKLNIEFVCIVLTQTAKLNRLNAQPMDLMKQDSLKESFYIL